MRRKILPILADLLAGSLLGAAFFFDVAVAIQSRALVYLFFVVPGVVALGVGFWRGRARVIPAWLDLVLLNLPVAGGAAILALTEGARTILLVPILTLCATGLGIAAARKPASPQGKRALRILALAAVAAVTVLTLFVHPIVESLIAVKTLNRPVAPFQLSLLDGGMVSSASLRGKVVVLDFFTTWCEPCRHEFPELEKVYSRFRNRSDVAFYAVDGDRGDTPEQAGRYFREAGYRLPVCFDHGSKVYEIFGAPGFPTLVILDREGHLRFRHSGYLGAEDFAGKLTEHLNDLLGQS